MAKRSTRGTPGRHQGGAPARQQGGMPNMQQMMAQVQQMQHEMEAAQEQLAHEKVFASAGGGMVTVQMTGDLRLQAVAIDPEAVDPEDVDMLADMVMAAVNEALRAAQELAASRLGGVSGGLDLGGLGGLPGLQP